MFRTSNPAMKESVFTQLEGTTTDRMTIGGAVNKTAILLFLAVASAAWTWHSFTTGAAVNGYVLVGAIGGFIVAMITIFKRSAAPITAPLYAVLEGLFLGGISATFNQTYPGIAFGAVGLTFGTLGCLLIAYRSGVIRATENFKLGVVAATGGIVVFYLVSIVLSFFHVNVPLIYSAGPFGIGFSVLVVIIAALNLVLDFDLIETGERLGAPKYMEWYSAFALMVTLVWLYLEILRLLAKLQSRR